MTDTADQVHDRAEPIEESTGSPTPLRLRAWDRSTVDARHDTLEERRPRPRTVR